MGLHRSLLFHLFFFRDPQRDIKSSSQSLLAPADGKIYEINKLMGIIKIRMSIFNVHVTRSPITGNITEISYQKGKHWPFFSFIKRGTHENERQIITIESNLGEIQVVQIVGIIARKIFVKKNFRMANPVRWFRFIAYIFGPFFVGMAKANVDVAYRVITGKINPGIVKISPDLKTDLGITMLANSITLTPGTLSVDIDEEKNDLYIHWINVKKGALQKKPVDYKFVCGEFPKWIRRIAE